MLTGRGRLIKENRIFAFGPVLGLTKFLHPEIYYIDENRWSNRQPANPRTDDKKDSDWPLPPLSQERIGGKGGHVGDYIYVFGGTNK